MTKLRKFAEGRSCTLRIPGVCSFDSGKTQLAHGHGAGMGTKLYDWIGVHACSECHAYLDTQSRVDGTYEKYFARGLLETLQRVDTEGLMP